jgi:hypothetical protein
VKLRGLVHRLLGGATDDEGRPELGIDDWVEVFDGLDPDVSTIREAFHDHGLEVRAHVYVPLGSSLGVTAEPRTSVCVRPADVDRANNLLDVIPHLGRRQATG